MTTRSGWWKWAVVGFVCSAWTVLAAPLGSAVTYQGQLKDNGVPVNGTAAMTFQLFDAPTAGALAQPSRWLDRTG